MLRARRLIVHVISAAALFGTSLSFALQPDELTKIVPQTQLSIPLPVNGIYDVRLVKVDVVGVFKDADGSEWLRIEGVATADNEPQTVFIDASSGEIELGLNVGNLELADLETSIDQLRGMAKAGEGSLVYEGKKYIFSGAGPSQFSEGANAKPIKVGYFILQSEQDHNLSLMVLNWGDRVEVLQNEHIDAKQVSLSNP